MGQNVQFFFTCGGPRCCYPEWFKKAIDFKEGPQVFQRADGVAGSPAVELEAKRTPTDIRAFAV